jgi:hypothetical protein
LLVEKFICILRQGWRKITLKYCPEKLAYNGRRYATLRRASARRNVAEAERANARVAKPDEPWDIHEERVTGLLGEV